MVSLRLPSGCWPWAAQGKAGRLTVGAVAQARRPGHQVVQPAALVWSAGWGECM